LVKIEIGWLEQKLIGYREAKEELEYLGIVVHQNTGL